MLICSNAGGLKRKEVGFQVMRESIAETDADISCGLKDVAVQCEQAVESGGGSKQAFFTG